MTSIPDEVRRAAEALRDADALLITAGAGMGVDSGLPDFRGTQGFWKAYPKLAQLGRSFVEIANPEAFDEQPSLAWAFYGHRLNLYRKTQPHAGYGMLLDLGRKKKHGYFIFTSNVDGHFQKAGGGEDHIVECHGSIHHLQCLRPCCQEIWAADDAEVAIDEQEFVAQEPLPRCLHCGGLARPNVLMFGDWRWIDLRTAVQEDRLEHWLTQLHAKEARLVIIEIGAGKAIPSVRNLSEGVAARTNGVLVRINPQDAEAPKEQISIPLRALEGIERIVNAMQ